MSRIQKIKDSPHYLRLKESVEYRYDKKQFILISVFSCIVLVPLILLFAIVCESSGDAAAAVAMDFLLMLILLGFWLYLGYRWLEIFLHIDSYIFCEVLLDQPHIENYGRYGSRIRFTVAFTDRHGKQLKRDTAAMFSSGAEPYLEDYNNKTVLIGYNEETDRVVVIKRVDG